MSNWLSNYLDYTQYQESPELFHKWVGIITIAATMGRSVWTDRRAVGVSWYQVYPGQMMMVLVAPSGRGHKGTALRLGKKLMDEVGVFTIKGKGSTEKIINLLSNPPPAINGTIIHPPHAVGCLYIPELSVMLSKSTYAESMIDFLTDIYDAEHPFPYMTQGGGVITLNYPCVSMAAGATPTSIAMSIPEKAHESGYLGRVIHVWHDGFEREANPLTDLDDSDMTPDQLAGITQLKATLTTRLVEIKKLHGPFIYEPSARRWFNEWYESYRQSDDGQGEGWPTRRPDHLLRVAMVLCAAETDQLIHTKARLQTAHGYIQAVEKGFHHAFAAIGQQTKTVKHKERILYLLRTSPSHRMSAPAIYSAIHHYFDNLDELRAIMRDLVESQVIKNDGVNNQGVQYFSIP